MFSVLQKCKDPQLLVLTPLLPNHKISKETKTHLKRNDIEFDWVSYASHNNIPTNASLALENYKKKFPNQKINYIIMIDRDIIPSRNMLYNMYNTLSKSKKDVAYCYCNFEFRGKVNRAFKHIEFNAINLLRSNYISSNSMIKLDKLEEIGGFVIDPDLKRLLDWALWLKFLNAGYSGILCNSVSFIAESKTGDVSTGSDHEYWTKYKLVKERFIDPMLEGLII